MKERAKTEVPWGLRHRSRKGGKVCQRKERVGMTEKENEEGQGGTNRKGRVELGEEQKRRE